MMAQQFPLCCSGGATLALCCMLLPDPDHSRHTRQHQGIRDILSFGQPVKISARTRPPLALVVSHAHSVSRSSSATTMMRQRRAALAAVQK
jgi:hypothetical protein